MKAILIWLLLLPGLAAAQTTAAPVNDKPMGAGAYDWFGAAGWVCGAGASTSTAATKPTVQCGGVFQLPLFALEAGVMGPQANQSNISAYLSTNLVIPLRSFGNGSKVRNIPLLTGGYTRMFETGHAVDYGFAFAHAVDSEHSVQFELKDYWAFSNPHQHNIVFRVVWLVGLAD